MPELTEDQRMEMGAFAGALEERFPGLGFALLIFDLNGPDDSTMNYISNANRDDMLHAMGEFIHVVGAEEQP